MKKVAGTLKIEQAQYKELESFSKFSSDIDKVTQAALDKGRKNSALLIQPQYSPMSVAEQVAVLYCGTQALMADIDLGQVPLFEQRFLENMRSQKPEVLKKLAEGILTKEETAAIEETAALTCSSLIKS